MKILVLGDIHGRLIWYDIIQKEQPDKIIFLGDYVSTHGDISADQQCMNLEDILNYKVDNPDKVVLLRGNHDLQHLGYYWAECSGLDMQVLNYMCEPYMKLRFLDNTQWIHIEDNLIFSHAGISKVWWDSLKLGEPTRENLLKINELEPSEKFAFTPSSMSDYCGDSFTQPCTWIRPTSLAMNHIEGWDQVVGHTRVRKPGNIMPDLEFYRENWNITMKEFWCIDALPSQYMIIEDGIRTMRDVKDITDIDNIINNI